MKLSRRQFLHLAVGVAALLPVSQPAHAQGYPSRPITMIVPFPPGGGTDITARIIQEHLSRTLGQEIAIENIAGAGGTIGTTRAMSAAPDGYTIEMGSMGTLAAVVAFYPNLAYKPESDFAPIGLVSSSPVMMVARRDFPAKDLKDFVSYVRANAEKLNMAHAGVGSVGYTCGVLFNSIVGASPTLVPFNGAAAAIDALIGGQVDFMCDGGANNTAPHVQSGTIKAYTIEAEERSPILPNVPTAKEAGLPDFKVSGWNGLFAPKGTPKPILDRLSDALDRTLDDDITRKRLIDRISEIPDKASRGQQPLADLVKRDVARWVRIIKAAGGGGGQ